MYRSNLSRNFCLGPIVKDRDDLNDLRRPETEQDDCPAQEIPNSNPQRRLKDGLSNHFEDLYDPPLEVVSLDLAVSRSDREWKLGIEMVGGDLDSRGKTIFVEAIVGPCASECDSTDVLDLW